MYKLLFAEVILIYFLISVESSMVKSEDLELTVSDKFFQYVPLNNELTVFSQDGGQTDSTLTILPPHFKAGPRHYGLEGNPLVAALILSGALGLPPKPSGYNHPQHLPVNPYIALLLSHYGRYLPVYGPGKGLYSYSASNNYHNNQPLGAYKIYEDVDV